MKKGQSAKEKKWKRATGVGPLGLGPLGDMLGNIKYGDLPQGTDTYRIAIKGSERGREKHELEPMRLPVDRGEGG
jgi:hypothetical protein